MHVTFRLASTEAEHADVLELRDAVYVQDQERLADATDTAATFDRFDGQAQYIVGYHGDNAVGTIKVVPDSPLGLPCDDTVDLSGLRPGNRLVEFGHLMTLPTVRSRNIGVALMREALVHSVRVHRATHVLGDFFVDDDSGGLRSFYRAIGFVALHEPYRDVRFQGAPLSLVAVLDTVDAARRARADEHRRNRMLQFFFGDYDTYAGDLPKEVTHAHPAPTAG
ncbi:GNAT family N-acetyltransferase [Streptomyces sp. NPDC047315]|uniref:GNAT family N-acetyltransferase n=1 Tax=Streptomyces sp. NPDC047315 TaxID=3155142 RepID=UPI0034116C76